MNNFFEDGEIRIGVQSPGPGWVRLDGSRITLKNKKILKKLTNVFWNTQTSNFGSSGIEAVAYGNGVWVAGGAAGTLRTSGGTEPITLPTFNLLGSSVYGWVKT